jgi:hypothetical protein
MPIVAEIRALCRRGPSDAPTLARLSRSESALARSVVIVRYPASGDAQPFPRDGREAAATDVYRALRGQAPRFANWKGQQHEYEAAREELVQLIAAALATRP